MQFRYPGIELTTETVYLPFKRLAQKYSPKITIFVY